MKTRWQELRNKHWTNRTAQERFLILTLSAVLTPVVYYFLLWQPAHLAVGQLEQTLPTLRAQSLKLLDQATEVEALRHRPQLAALDSVALKISLEDSAQRKQLRSSITSIEMQESNGVRITCDAISFNLLLTWMRDIQQEQHIRAESLSIVALPQTGMVKVNATFTNGSNP